MHKFMEIVVYILALIGLACVVKHMSHQEGCWLCGWQKVKEEVQHATEKASHKIKVDEEKTTGTRYGSNPINY
ncbi:MAG: hypothetical protein QG646_1204 [Euryarchaeota archaeon]|nr:hypothetical protein [Euryarchaeota archaeon]